MSSAGKLLVCPDSAVAAWRLDCLDMGRAEPSWSLTGRLIGLRAPVVDDREAWTTVYPASGVDAVDVVREGDVWNWVLREGKG